MTVFDRLVGQDRVVATLRRARDGDMTHAWLFTGPPGSGRSNAAVAFAAALQCERGGCGECHSCRTALKGSHEDITVMRTEKLTIGVDDVRDLVRRAALSPVGDRYQVFVVEDADRLTEPAINALLKAIEEPSERTVWLLCAPTVEDVLPTIRSRTRLVVLATPLADDIAAFLTATVGVAGDRASYAARASQGHIGRARALATDDESYERRRSITLIPGRLSGLGSCLEQAEQLHALARAEAEAIGEGVDQREKEALDVAYGVVDRGRRPREYAPELRRLEQAQKTRAKRRVLDVVDRGLMDLASVYRDAVAVQVGAPGALVNEGQRAEVEALARDSTPEQNLVRIDAIFEAREQMLEFNVAALTALESLMVALR